MICARFISRVAIRSLAISLVFVPIKLGFAQGITNPAVPLPPTPTPAQQPAPPAITDGSAIQDPLGLTTPTPTAQPARRTPATTASNRSRSDSTFSPRLARAPFMLGDSIAPVARLSGRNRVEHPPVAARRRCFAFEDRRE